MLPAINVKLKMEISRGLASGDGEMNKLFLASVTAIALASGNALAADMATKAPPVPAPAPAYNWTGFYIEGSAGYGWGQSGSVDPTGSTTFISAIAGSPSATSAMVAAIPNSLPVSPRGFIAGGGFGYNYQINKVVWGLEADFSGANIAGSGSGGGTVADVGFPGVTTTSAVTASQRLDFLGTVRGRLGYTPTDRLLVYGTGGLAYGHVSSSTTVSEVEAPTNLTLVNITPANGSASTMRTGWVAGGGLEWAWSSQWSVKAEYLHYDLGSLTYSAGTLVGFTGGAPPPGLFGTVNVSSTTHFAGDIVRLGVSYKFGGAQ
jgi:outer membrane immunogenic protein